MCGVGVGWALQKRWVLTHSHKNNIGKNDSMKNNSAVPGADCPSVATSPGGPRGEELNRELARAFS